MEAAEPSATRLKTLLITFDSVSKSYDTRTRKALDDISFTADRGEFVFLVGASGSGKSTVIRLILREEVPTKGRITVAGKSVVKMPSWRVPYLRRGIGTVFQDFRLLPNKTVFANVSFALQVIGKSRAAMSTLVPDVLETVGLAGKQKRYPHELSGGQRQRVAIARALALRPKLLIADEPTSALDVSVQRGVLRLLADLHEVREFACLFISHDLAVVEQLASSVVVLRDGRIVEEGSSRQVLTDPQQPYTRELIESAPVPDPAVQAARRAARLAA